MASQGWPAASAATSLQSLPQLPNTANVFGVDPLAQFRKECAELSPEEWKAQRDSLLLKWRAERDELERAKANELETRNKLVAMLFDPEKEEGTETLELGGGWKVKAQKKLNYTLGDSRADPQFKSVGAALDTIEGLPLEEAKFLADRLVRWKPELAISEYRLLETDERFTPVKEIIDRVLTVKPGTPSFELIEPNAGPKKGKRR